MYSHVQLGDNRPPSLELVVNRFSDQKRGIVHSSEVVEANLFQHILT